MPLVISFADVPRSDRKLVGGKGYSLIRLTAAGLPVPPGSVLTTEFFESWFEELKTTELWSRLVEAKPDEWSTLCPDLKALSRTLPMSGAQQQALSETWPLDAEPGRDRHLLAVRSSSPEEDLAAASFAGGYETRLGVGADELEDAVRHCFASSLDARVLAYKHTHGLDVLQPRIAVVIQRQIDSEVGGVGFSINPVTNDYDEAVINANWGLGESVVAGLAVPDHFVVNKVTGRLVASTLGAKQVSIWLGAPDWQR